MVMEVKGAQSSFVTTYTISLQARPSFLMTLKVH